MDVIKSSRFWIAALIVIGAVVLAALGKISAEAALAIAGSILAGFGVAKFAPGSSSSGTDPKALLPFALVLAIASQGCASWQVTTKASIDSASALAETTHVAVVAHYNPKCEALARTCGTAAKAGPTSVPILAPEQPDPSSCPALAACLDEKHKWNTAIKAVQVACVAGYGALAIAAKEKALEYMIEAGRQINELLAALKAAKVMP